MNFEIMKASKLKINGLVFPTENKGKDFPPPLFN